jgi:hypothetical protein
MLASLVNDYYASWNDYENDMRINVCEHGNNKATFDMIMSCEQLSKHHGHITRTWVGFEKIKLEMFLKCKYLNLKIIYHNLLRWKII